MKTVKLTKLRDDRKRLTVDLEANENLLTVKTDVRYLIGDNEYSAHEILTMVQVVEVVENEL